MSSLEQTSPQESMFTPATLSSRNSANLSWMLPVGVLLILAGVVINWLAMRRTEGFDFTYLYVLGRMLLSGQSAYDLGTREATWRGCCGTTGFQGQPYPPSTGLIVLPLSLLPFAAARILWFALCLLALLGGIAYLLKSLQPALSTGKIALIVGLVACSSCVRWGFTILQSAPLLAGLFAFFIGALLRERLDFVFLSGTVALAIKPTYAPAFVFVLLLQRRFNMTAALLAVVLGLNVLGFIRVGGMPAVQAYRNGIARLQTLTSINYPDPHSPVSVERLDWVYALNAIHPDVPLSQKTATILTLLGAGWLLWKGMQIRLFARDKTTLRMFLAPICCLSTLCVYHNHYEAPLLLIPSFAYFYGTPNLRLLPGVRWYLVPLLLYIAIYPVDKIKSFAVGHFSVNVTACVKAFGAFVVVFLFCASLIALQSYLTAKKSLLAMSPEGIG